MNAKSLIRRAVYLLTLYFRHRDGNTQSGEDTRTPAEVARGLSGRFPTICNTAPEPLPGFAVAAFICDGNDEHLVGELKGRMPGIRVDESRDGETFAASCTRASLAYAGGGFGKGRRSLLEGVMAGIPVAYGPVNGRYAEAGEMKALGFGFEIRSAEALCRLAMRLSHDSVELGRLKRWASEYREELAGAERENAISVP